MRYIVKQMVLREKLFGTASVNPEETERIINEQAEKGYRLHSFSTVSSGSKGLLGGDRIQVTMVFEKEEGRIRQEP